MLSQDLSQMHAWFAAYISGEIKFTTEVAIAFRDALQQLAIDAAAVEQALTDAETQAATRRYLSHATYARVLNGIAAACCVDPDSNVLIFPRQRMGVPFSDGRDPRGAA